MYKRVFKQKGSRVYRLRYRVSNEPRVYDIPLHTPNKELAEIKARQIIDDHEKELLGLLPPKFIRDAAQRPLTEHLVDFIADLNTRGRCKGHVIHTNCRLQRLLEECGWHKFGDATVDGFTKWRSAQSKLSAKTLNEYLGHAVAFFNWLVRQGRAMRNPLKPVVKLEIRGKETFKRRALSCEDLFRLVQSSGKRSLAYLVAGCTGLRRGEMKQLLWSDIRLDAPQPFIDVRAETTKSKKSAVIPLVPPLVEALKKARAKKVQFSDRVFLRGLPSIKTLTKDLMACGIPVEDERGYRVDFHALRHTFASMLASAGVSELARVKLARHSEWRQTDRYTDPQSIPLFGEMEKMAAILPSLGASLKSGKTGKNAANPVQIDFPLAHKKIVPFRGERPCLGKAVPSWESANLVPEGGLEPPCG
jgi:integrase